MEYVISEYPGMPSEEYKRLKMTVLKTSHDLLEEFTETEIVYEIFCVCLQVMLEERNLPTYAIDAYYV
jgi:hypothetical protein